MTCCGLRAAGVAAKVHHVREEECSTTGRRRALPVLNSPVSCVARRSLLESPAPPPPRSWPAAILDPATVTTHFAAVPCFEQLHRIDEDKLANLYAKLRQESASSGGVPIAVRHIESVMRMAEVRCCRESLPPRPARRSCAGLADLHVRPTRGCISGTTCAMMT